MLLSALLGAGRGSTHVHCSRTPRSTRPGPPACTPGAPGLARRRVPLEPPQEDVSQWADFQGVEWSSESDEKSDEDPEPLLSRPITASERAKNGIGRAQLVRDELTVLFLDWVSSFKLTDAAAAGAWHLLNVMWPDGVDMATFSQVRVQRCLCSF